MKRQGARGFDRRGTARFSIAVLAAILCVSLFAGAAAAEAGEYTKRVYIDGEWYVLVEPFTGNMYSDTGWMMEHSPEYSAYLARIMKLGQTYSGDTTGYRVVDVSELGATGKLGDSSIGVPALCLMAGAAVLLGTFAHRQRRKFA